MKNFKRTVLAALLTGMISGCGSAEDSSQRFIESGKELMEQGEFDKARLEFRNALQINPLEAEGYYQLALIDEKNQKWKGMYSNLVTVESLDPNHVPAIVKLGQLHVVSGQLDEAMKKAEKALSLEPDNTEAILLKATTLIKQENFGMAEVEINRVLAVDSKNMEALTARVMLFKNSGQTNKALTAADEALAIYPDAMPLKMIKLSIFQEMDDYAAMEKLYRELLPEYPNESWVAVSLAKLLNDTLNRPEESQKVLEDYVAQNPEDAETIMLLVSLINSRNPDLAMAKLDEFIEAKPDNQELRFAKIEMLSIQGKQDLMVSELESIIAAEPDSEIGLRARATIAGIKAQEGKFEEAENMVNEVLAISSEHEQALLLKAKLQLKNEQLDPAISNLRVLIRNNAELDEAMVLLAQAYALTGSSELAENSFRQALSVNPANPQAALSVASVLMRGNDLDRTEQVLVRALEGNANNENLLQALAQVRILKRDWAGTQQAIDGLTDTSALTHLLTAQMYQGLNDNTLAIAEYEAALKLEPSLTRALQQIMAIRYQQEQKEEIVAFLNKHIAEHPELTNGYIVLADYYRMDGNLPDAIATIDSALAKNEDWTEGYSLKANLHYLNKEPDAAIAAFEKGLSKAPENNQLAMQLASTHESKKEFEKARQLYEEVIARDPSIDVAANNLSSLLSEQFESPENLQRALVLSSRFRDSDQPYFADTFGWVNYKLGNYEEARPALERAASSGESIALFHYHLGRLYLALEMPEEARRSLERAQQMATEDNDEALIGKIGEQLSNL
ncbi:tetratricopeptide repeat protein [Methylophaga pinxianii]|uniref:tetratricopeptide repeat protein n=1 Tax=Methylophaga pinxianii TaxID=2881052 RepID=UPI001CF12B4B|nr:tetratricopeptide repeat protein [Methylophaga pinxianii]MCB2426643.1 tetratricopeptide repeat protein [Methylophaga pinxianii]UPH45097.1 tetratricopeptide repeat protein [Methylophaga pinxianii]